VLPHWRIPVFRRLAAWPGIELLALHGSDFPGTKTLNARDLSGFEHRELWTIRLVSRITAEREIAFPLWPTAPWHLWRERPDVLLLEGGSNLPSAFLLVATALCLRIPVVWWTLGEIPHPHRLTLSQRIFRALVRFLERRCTAFLGFSSMARAYFQRCGYPPEAQFVAVNCVDTDAVKERIPAARAQVAALRERLGLGDERVLLFVGSLAPYKRVEDLISVYARLRERHRDLRLVVVGGGSHRSALEAHAREVGAADLIFTGEVVDGIDPYFEMADVLVLPGLGGLAISEAMTHGLPVVSSLADGCERDLIEEGRNGYVVEPRDTRRLEACLEELLSDPERLRAMGEHSRRIVDERYNIGTYMESLVAALRYGAARGARTR
jgi:glycosyltransferase involved in cell wall biosynthesis